MVDAYHHKHFYIMEYLQKHKGTCSSMSKATNFLTSTYKGDIHKVQTLYKSGNINIKVGDYEKRTMT